MRETASEALPGFHTPDVSRYLALVRRWWWLALAGAAVGGAAAYFITNSLTPMYRASATLLVNQVQQPGAVVYNDILTSERLTQTYRELIKQRPVLEGVVSSGFVEGATLDELRSNLDVDVIKDTQLLRVSVTNADPQRAADLANAVALTFVQQESGVNLSRPGATSVVEQAQAPSAPVSPHLTLNVALAVLAGLFLAGGVALLLEYMDDTLKSAEDVRLASGLTTLGEMGRWRSRAGEIHLVDRTARAPEAEAYAVLRTNLQFSTLGAPARVLLITSGSAGEGKSTTASNLALAMAEAGRSVVLVDADLRRPSLHHAFKLDNRLGLTSALLAGGEPSADVVQSTPLANLSVVTSGPLPPNPAELLDWQGFDQTLEWLKSRADVVILDSPPVLAVADARILAARADATILVVDSGRTRPGSLRDSREALVRANANLVGVALNKVRRGRRGYYYYYYSSRPGEEKRSRRRGRRARKAGAGATALQLSTNGHNGGVTAGAPPGSARGPADTATGALDSENREQRAAAAAAHRADERPE